MTNEVTQEQIDAAFDRIYFEGYHEGETELEYQERRKMQRMLDEDYGLEPKPRILGKPKAGESRLFAGLMDRIKK